MSTQSSASGSTSPVADGGSAQDPAPRYPSSIVKAVWVMLAQIVLSWLGIALALIGARGNTPRGELTPYDQAVGEASVWVILFAIFFTALYAMLARQVLAGAHWAQVTVWFLAGSNAFFGIVGLVTAAQLGWSNALGVVSIASNIALVVLLAVRPSASHFGRTP